MKNKKGVTLILVNTILWVLISQIVHFILLKGKNLENLLLSIPTSFLLYLLLSFFLLATTYYRQRLLSISFFSLFFIIPLNQIRYFATYNDFVEPQIITFVVREPKFLLTSVIADLTIVNWLSFVFIWGLSILLHTYIFSKNNVNSKYKPFSLFNKWYWYLPISVLVLLQINWCIQRDISQIWSRPFYPIIFLAFVSTLYFLIRVSASYYKKFISFITLIGLLCFYTYISIFNPSWNKKLSYDNQFYAALYTAFFLSDNKVLTFEKNSDAMEKYKLLSSLKLDFNILIILNDSLRLDHSSYLGYERKTDNLLHNFYKKSFFFKYPIAIANFTNSALPALLTGMGTDKNVQDLKSNLSIWDYFGNNQNTFLISTQEISWSRLNKLYESSPGLQYIWSITENYEGSKNPRYDSVSANRLIEHIKGLKGNYVGIWQTETNHHWYEYEKDFDYYKPCKKDRVSTQEIINCYDNTIRYLSFLVNKVLKAIDLDNTVVVFLSDHGEAFGEHGVFFHGTDFHQEAVKVPFIFYLPPKVKEKIPAEKLKNFTNRLNSVVSTVDLVPTLLDLAKFTSKVTPPFEVNFTGESLFSTIKNERVIFSSGCYVQYICYSRNILFANNNYSLIFNPMSDAKNILLYDTHNDLKQVNPLNLANELENQKFMSFLEMVETVHPTGKLLIQSLKLKK